MTLRSIQRFARFAQQFALSPFGGFFLNVERSECLKAFFPTLKSYRVISGERRRKIS